VIGACLIRVQLIERRALACVPYHKNRLPFSQIRCGASIHSKQKRQCLPEIHNMYICVAGVLNNSVWSGCVYVRGQVKRAKPRTLHLLVNYTHVALFSFAYTCPTCAPRGFHLCSRAAVGVGATSQHLRDFCRFLQNLNLPLQPGCHTTD
jgi:hypothetical protein